MIPNSDAVQQLTELGFLLVTATEMSSSGGVKPPKRTASELYPTRERATRHPVQALELLTGLLQVTGAWTSHSTSGGGR